MTSAMDIAEFLRGPWTRRPAVLSDLDGCLISGDRVLPGVPALVEACGPKLWIVSNNSTDTAATLSHRLAALGIAVPADRIILAGEQTLRAIAAEYAGARIALFAAAPLHALSRDLGLVIDHERPDLAVLARDTAFDFRALTRLAVLVHEGVPLRITNPDPRHPGPMGEPLPETGALFAALSAVVPGARVSACLGKPAPDLIRMALARADVPASAAVFIGDTPQSDGRAAASAGVEFVRILSVAAPVLAGDGAW